MILHYCVIFRKKNPKNKVESGILYQSIKQNKAFKKLIVN